MDPCNGLLTLAFYHVEPGYLGEDIDEMWIERQRLLEGSKRV